MRSPLSHCLAGQQNLSRIWPCKLWWSGRNGGGLTANVGSCPSSIPSCCTGYSSSSSGSIFVNLQLDDHCRRKHDRSSPPHDDLHNHAHSRPADGSNFGFVGPGLRLAFSSKGTTVLSSFRNEFTTPSSSLTGALVPMDSWQKAAASFGGRCMLSLFQHESNSLRCCCLFRSLKHEAVRCLSSKALRRKKDNLEEGSRKASALKLSYGVDWFPGHMAAAARDMRQRLKAVDLVLEVRDARLPLSSRSDLLSSLISHKRRIIVLNKMDLADPQQQMRWEAHFARQQERVAFVSARNIGSVRRLLRRTIRNLQQDLLSSNQQQPPLPLLGMVVGVPNVGKSALINRMFQIGASGEVEAGGGREEGSMSGVRMLKPLSRKAAAKVGPLPGVTQQLSSFRVCRAPNLAFLDTPGVLSPRLADEATALKLAAVGCIKDGAIGEEKLACFLLSTLLRKMKSKEGSTKLINVGPLHDALKAVTSEYPDVLHQIEAEDDDVASSLSNSDVMSAILFTLKRQFGVRSKDENDATLRVCKKILQLFRDGSLGRHTLDNAE